MMQTAGTAPLVSILVVAFRSQDLIARCLDAIPDAAQSTSYEILLVDNGDGTTADLVAARYPQVRIIESRGNIGFAAGNNLLATHARGQYLLLLNPDMFLQANAIDELVAGAMRHPEAAAWGGVSVDAQGEPDTGNAIGEPSLLLLASAALGRSLANAATDRRYDTDEQVKILSGGMVLIAKTCWDEASGFDERFFLYCEEVDLFRRLRHAGWSLWRISTARGEHSIAHGASLSPSRILLMNAGTVEFLRKYYPGLGTHFGRLLIWIAAAERVVAGRLLGGIFPRLKQLGIGYSLVAEKPDLWAHGYDKHRGLSARLGDLQDG